MRDRKLIVKHVIDYISEIYFVAYGKTYMRDIGLTRDMAGGQMIWKNDIYYSSSGM